MELDDLLPLEIVPNDSLPNGVMMLAPNSTPEHLSPKELIQRGLAIMIRISDLQDPNDPQGRSYREVNATKTHKYPVGALVEFNHGMRLFVVHHARDCDQTPLYCLAADPNDTQIEREGFYNSKWVTGIAEQYLTFIRMVNQDTSCPRGGNHSWLTTTDSRCEKCDEHEVTTQ